MFNKFKLIIQKIQLNLMKTKVCLLGVQIPLTGVSTELPRGSVLPWCLDGSLSMICRLSTVPHCLCLSLTVFSCFFLSVYP